MFNSVEQMKEEELDRGFFDSLRGPSITKETIMNLCCGHIRNSFEFIQRV